MRASVIVSVGFLVGCAAFEPAKTPENALVEVPPTEYPAFTDDASYEGLAAALGNSRTWVKRALSVDPKRTTAFGTERVPLTKVLETIDRLEALVATKPPPDVLRDTIRREFRVFRSTGGDRDGTVLFTGYYLPELRGALECGGAYVHPLFGLPEGTVVARGRDFPQLGGEDLVAFVSGNTLKPLPTRAQITDGALGPKAKPVLWVDSAIDAFFLEIQGSGIVKLADGTTRVATYAGKNGHRYTAIGGELVRRGALKREEVSMQTIRTWLETHPTEAAEVMNTNPSFVFFRLGDAPEGSLGVPVTPGRSIATDTRVFPKGTPAFIETERPISETSEEWQRFGRLVVDQDTGGAIRTAGRVDVYWGSGAYAAHAAGRMKQPGKLYYLLAR